MHLLVSMTIGTANDAHTDVMMTVTPGTAVIFFLEQFIKFFSAIIQPFDMPQ